MCFQLARSIPQLYIFPVQLATPSAYFRCLSFLAFIYPLRLSETFAPGLNPPSTGSPNCSHKGITPTHGAGSISGPLTSLFRGWMPGGPVLVLTDKLSMLTLITETRPTWKEATGLTSSHRFATIRFVTACITLRLTALLVMGVQVPWITAPR